MSIKALYPQTKPGAEVGKTQKGRWRDRIPSKEGIDFSYQKGDAFCGVLKEITEAAKVESPTMKHSI